MIRKILLPLVLFGLLVACAGGTPTQVETPIPSDTPAPSPTREPVGDVVEGVNLSESGVTYTLPDEVRAQLLQNGGAPVQTIDGAVVGTVDSQNNVVSIVLPDHFVSGEKIRETTNGEVTYTFGDQVTSEGRWKFEGLPDGVQAVAFVVKDNNQWGLESGTVAIWFFADLVKGGGVQIINADNPLRIVWDADNNAQLVIDGSVLSLTINAPGENSDIQTVDLAPMPVEFVAQFEGTEFAVAGSGLTFKVSGGETVDVPGKLSGDKFEFSVNGATVSAELDDVAVWNVIEDNHLVIKGDNGIPAYQFNEETKVWEEVEQVSMVDAFNNTVPGWVVESSDVWDGQPTEEISASRRIASELIYEQYGFYTKVVEKLNLKQFKILEFLADDGTRIQKLSLDWVLNNGSQIVTLRTLTGDIIFTADRLHQTPQQLIESLGIGNVFNVELALGEPTSGISSLDLAKIWNKLITNSKLTCNQSNMMGCALEIGQLNTTKLPHSFLNEVVDGSHGDFVDLTSNTMVVVIRK